MKHTVYPDTIVGKIRISHLFFGLISSLLLVLLFGWFCSRIRVPRVRAGITKVEVRYDVRENVCNNSEIIEKKQVYEYPYYSINQVSHSVIVSPIINGLQETPKEDISLFSYLLRSGLPF